MYFPLLYVVIQVLQNRGLLYYEIDDLENALQDFLAATKVDKYVISTRITESNLFSLVPSFYWQELYCQTSYVYFVSDCDRANIIYCHNFVALKVSPQNPHIRHTLGLCYHR